MIECNDDCIYQKDGWCFLGFPSVVTNSIIGQCIYYVKDREKDTLINKKKNKF